MKNKKVFIDYADYAWAIFRILLDTEDEIIINEDAYKKFKELFNSYKEAPKWKQAIMIKKQLEIPYIKR